MTYCSYIRLSFTHRIYDESIYVFVLQLFRILIVYKRNCKYNTDKNSNKLQKSPIFPTKTDLWEGHGSNLRGQNYFFFYAYPGFSLCCVQTIQIVARHARKKRIFQTFLLCHSKKKRYECSLFT